MKNREAFNQWFESLAGWEDGVELWTRPAKASDIQEGEESDDGYELVAFGGYSGFPCEREIIKIDDEGNEFEDYEEIDFTAELQNHIHEDWSVILQEVGNEKLRYLVGFCTIVDSTSVQWVDLTQWAVTSIPDGNKFTSPEY